MLTSFVQIANVRSGQRRRSGQQTSNRRASNIYEENEDSESNEGQSIENFIKKFKQQYRSTTTPSLGGGESNNERLENNEGRSNNEKQGSVNGGKQGPLCDYEANIGDLSTDCQLLIQQNQAAEHQAENDHVLF